jgi:glycosyltransferase involved in cell wall biosynthesis
MNPYKEGLKEKYPDAWRWISLSKRVHGWLTDAEANSLFSIAQDCTPNCDPVVVELGSWCGKSSVLLAAGLRGKSNARLYCVDTFESDEDPQYQENYYAPHIGRMRCSIEAAFRRNVRRCGVGQIVRMIKGYSYEVVRSWKDPIDVLFIDANHEYKCVRRDFGLWSPFVKASGIVVVHDVAPQWPGPTQVMQEEMQPPFYAGLQQVDSLAWAIRQPSKTFCVPLSLTNATPVSDPACNGRNLSGSLHTGDQDWVESNDTLGSMASEADVPNGAISAEERSSRIREQLIGALDRAIGQVTALRAESSLATGELDRLTSEVDRRDAECKRLTLQLVQRESECEALLELAATHETDKRQLNEQLAAEQASHTADLQAGLAELERFKEVLSEKDGHISSLERHTQQLADQLDNIQDHLERTTAALEESRQLCEILRQSWSWKLRAGLRAVLGASSAVRQSVKGDVRDLSLRAKALGLFQWLWYRNEVRASGLFDDSYYLAHNPDVAASQTDPLRHFFLYGVNEGRNPHRLFDVRYYCLRNRDVMRSGVNPLVHYLKWGASEGRDPHPHFVTAFYLDRYPEVRKSGLNALAHFMGPGVTQGFDPNPWFDTSEYLECNPEVALRGKNPLVHHLDHRESERHRAKIDIDAITHLAAGVDMARMRPQGIDPRTTRLRARLRSELELSGRTPLDSEYDSAPLVSVIIPCYNYGYYLEDAILSSMLACSYPMEIIVVDDGSTDRESVAETEALAARYQFRLVKQAHAGLASARLTGVRNSSCKFVQFLDADDLLAPGKIDLQVDMMLGEAQVDIPVCEYELCDADGEGRRLMQPSTLAGFELKPEDFLLRWERGFSLPIHCALFRREMLKEEQFPCVTKAGKEDWIFWITLQAMSPRFQFHQDVMATYRIHGRNACKDRETMGLDFLRASMYLVERGMGRCDGFLEESINHFRKAYLGSIKHEAILWSRAHSGE